MSYYKKQNKELLQTFIFAIVFVFLTIIIYKNISVINQKLIFSFKLGSIMIIVFTFLVIGSLGVLFDYFKEFYYYQESLFKFLCWVIIVLIIFNGYMNRIEYYDSLSKNVKNIKWNEISPFEAGIENDFSKDTLNTISDNPLKKIEKIFQDSPEDIKEKYSKNPKEISFKYFIDGRERKIKLTLYKGINNYLASLDRYISYSYVAPSTKDFIIKQLDNNIQKVFLDEITQTIKNITSNKEKQARIAISLVQNIPYDWEGFDSSNLNSRYPYEVLYDNKGVCGEKTQLLIYFLRSIGFDTAYFSFELEDHASVGIKCPNEYSYLDSGYCFVESTTPNIITDSYGEYVGAGKLSSTPEIIKISNGISFNNVKEDYYDAINYQNYAYGEGYLSSSEFKKYSELIKKYNLEYNEECDGEMCNGICFESCDRGRFKCTSNGGVCEI